MTTSVKTCFKCNEEQSVQEFYKHPRMADGRLNKCKSCTKHDVHQHRRNPKFREKILAYDRARGARQSPEYRNALREKHPEKDAARNAVNNAIRDGRLEKPSRCSHCHKDKARIVGHHHDYSQPLVVTWLCDVCHRQLHALLDTVEASVQAAHGHE